MAFDAVDSEALEKDLSYVGAMRILYRLSYGLTAVIIVLLVVLFWTIRKGPPADRHFAMTSEGRRLEMTALVEPAVNMNAVLQWATQSAVQIMTFGFHDLNSRFSDSRHLFTVDGWESFLKALVRSGIFSTVTKQQQIVTAIPEGEAKITYEGLRDDGTYGWDIEVPLRLTVRAGNQQKSASVTAILSVEKVKTRLNPNGLAIAKWFMY